MQPASPYSEPLPFGQLSAGAWWMLVTVAAGIPLVAAMVWSMRFAYADHLIREGSPEAAARACAADPGNAQCRYLQAEILEQVGRDATTAWAEAVRLNPRNALAVTRAGIAAESRGNRAEAERYYLQAERFNQLWLPRWTLANYYMRQGDLPRMWAWMRKAFDRSYGDRGVMFRLCREAGGETTFLLREVIPPDRGVLAAFLEFLLNEGDTDSLPGAAARLVDQMGPAPRASVWDWRAFVWTVPAEERQASETRLVLAAVDQMLAARQPEPAVALWNRLSEKKLIPYDPWTAESPLINGRLRDEPRQTGLDWRLPKQEGVTSLWLEDAAALKFSLSGQQAEAANLLSQPLFLKAGRGYEVEFEYRTRGTGKDSGITWQFQNSSSEDLTSEDWTHSKLPIPAGAQDRLGQLVLVAQRKQGHKRPEGDVWVRNIQCRPLP